MLQLGINKSDLVKVLSDVNNVRAVYDCMFHKSKDLDTKIRTYQFLTHLKSEFKVNDIHALDNIQVVDDMFFAPSGELIYKRYALRLSGKFVTEHLDLMFVKRDKMIELIHDTITYNKTISILLPTLFYMWLLDNHLQKSQHATHLGNLFGYRNKKRTVKMKVNSCYMMNIPITSEIEREYYGSLLQMVKGEFIYTIYKKICALSEDIIND